MLTFSKIIPCVYLEHFAVVVGSDLHLFLQRISRAALGWLQELIAA